MKNNASLKKHLLSFEENRKKSISSFPSPDERAAYASAIAECFVPCAKKIFAGHFEVKDNESGVVREIHPTVIELYYHEERVGGFKDPIMYHTKDRKYYDYYVGKNGELKTPKSPSYFNIRGINNVPFFPVGSLNPHSSGIDVTFENPKEEYRASFLIREYELYFRESESQKRRVPGTIKNSTDIYDDMLIYGISYDGIVWKDDNNEYVKEQELDPKAYIEKHCTNRKNVPAYLPLDVRPKDQDCPQLWRKKEKADGMPPYIKSGDFKYEHCSFPWQFRSAEIEKKK